MLELVSHGRGIEILLRVADQTRASLEVAGASYESLMASSLKFPNLHPPQTLPKLFANAGDRARVQAARSVADKLAHGLYRHARRLIDEYKAVHALQTKLTAVPVRGLRVEAMGHLIEEDGRRIEKIEDEISSSDDSLIVEEYEVFVANGYAAASKEISDDAWRRIAAVQPALASDVAHLRMFRGLKRGKRIYSAARDPDTPKLDDT
jgi:hypothetical protein